MRQSLTRLLVAGSVAVSLSITVRAADRAEITFSDGRVFPESVTSTHDGAIYFGSVGRNAIYRAGPDSSKADVWITLGNPGDQTVTGVFADEQLGTLWVCTSANGGRNGAPRTGETALRAFSLSNKAPQGVYPLPGDGVCNDIAVAHNGTVYVSDTVGRRVLRLNKPDSRLEVWSADAALVSPDGIAVLADGVYVGIVRTGELVRIGVNADGSAGAVMRIGTSQKLVNPDGMRSVGDNTLLLTETVGRLDEITVRDGRADVRVVKEGLVATTAVTLVNGLAYVTEAKLTYWFDPKLKDQDPGPFRAVGVPYVSK